MRVDSDRRWRFDVGAAEIWDTLAVTEHYRRWWPWLRRLDAQGLVVGDVWHCTVQPPLPYSLQFTITIDEVVEGERIVATVGGDIAGQASVDLSGDEHAAEVRLASSLAPANRFLQAVALVARPVARFGHDWVLDTGAKQFRARAL